MGCLTLGSRSCSSQAADSSADGRIFRFRRQQQQEQKKGDGGSSGEEDLWGWFRFGVVDIDRKSSLKIPHYFALDQRIVKTFADSGPIEEPEILCRAKVLEESGLLLGGKV